MTTTQQHLQQAVNDFAENQIAAFYQAEGAGQHLPPLYDQLLQTVEPPLLAQLLRECHGNQSRCATILGINRATLRTKLKRYDLI